MKIKPINDGVLIEEVQKELKTEAGIILEKTAPTRRRNGTVLAVGKGNRNQDGTFTPLSVKEGDVVLFNHANGNDVVVGGKTYQMCRELDVVGIFE